jgi:Leucine-rich repeat (LRR) protein
VPENYLGRIVSIDLCGCEAVDDHLLLIRSCQQLEKLDLSGTQITVGALQGLGRLPCLQILAVRDLEITDDDVRALAALRRLRLLDATGCAISPTAAAALESIPRLSLVERPATLA